MFKLVILLIVLLMPLGMTPVSASAPHQAVAGLTVGHCPDQSSGHDSKRGIAECAMACAAALPATAAVASDEPFLIASAPGLPLPAQSLRGLHPETATPPPKQA